MLSFATFRFVLSSSKKIFVVALAFLFVAGTLFAKKDEAKNSAHAIIPRPTSYVAKTGKFIFSPETLIVFSAKEAKPVATYFAGEIAAATGMKLKVAEKGTGKNTVRLELKKFKTRRRGLHARHNVFPRARFRENAGGAFLRIANLAPNDAAGNLFPQTGERRRFVEFALRENFRRTAFRVARRAS